MLLWRLDRVRWLFLLASCYVVENEKMAILSQRSPPLFEKTFPKFLMPGGAAKVNFIHSEADLIASWFVWIM